MKVEITAALIALAGAGFGMLITIYVTRYSLTLAARQRFAASFTDELIILKAGTTDGNECMTYRLLDDAFPKHNRAYIKLYTALGWFDRWRIEKHWQKYQYGGEPYEEPSERFRYLLAGLPEEPKSMGKAIKHINSLMS
jgi:hypothetical protein